MGVSTAGYCGSNGFFDSAHVLFGKLRQLKNTICLFVENDNANIDLRTGLCNLSLQIFQHCQRLIFDVSTR